MAKKVGDSGSNVLMNLRKAASHPLLFRTHYNDALLRVVAKDIMKEPEHMTGDYNLIIEDMEVSLGFVRSFFPSGDATLTSPFSFARRS